MLNEAQRKRLLEIARQSIASYLKTNKRPDFQETDPILTSKKGAFVTLKKKGQLRGCIGHIMADSPLYKIVSEMAVHAAVSDMRFSPVTPEELDDIKLEISALSELEKIDSIQDIQVGKHGLLIKKGFTSGLLLPQVATEYNWNRKQFLEQTCYKAGLPNDAWRTDAEIFIFSADVFGED